jgi:hypothetical protein
MPHNYDIQHGIVLVVLILVLLSSIILIYYVYIPLCGANVVALGTGDIIVQTVSDELVART